ncbi:MAG TPA: hypothetical protein VHL58_00635, partial [Thermoanaerobaculia bacterium]|nr:hypothetical protein [Thermoanaerobaculia bacterium]
GTGTLACVPRRRAAAFLLQFNREVGLDGRHTGKSACATQKPMRGSLAASGTLRGSMRLLLDHEPIAPAPLTTRQLTSYAVLALLTAASRLLAIARSPWDWDEMLFCLALRHYDVAAHHPHPPGFPFFIALGKLFRLFTGSDFRALQFLTVGASMLLFPAVVDLGREVGMKPLQAMLGGLLCCFFPNVWFYSGTAFSDVSSLVLSVLAVAMMLRGRRSLRAFWLGALLFGCAIAVRPQNLLVGALPFLWAAWTRRRRPSEVVMALAIVGAVVTLFFGGAVVETGSWQRFSTAVSEHRTYILANDSFHSPSRAPLHILFWDFFFRQYQYLGAGYVVSLFVLIATGGAIARRQAPQILLALIFGPFCLLAWLMLDRFSISRFAVAYMPLFALLGAIGIGMTAGLLGRGRALFAVTTTVIIVSGFISFAWRPLHIVRTTDSPPIAAVNWVRTHLQPQKNSLLLGFGMTPFHDYYLPDFRFIHVHDANAIALDDVPDAFLLSEGEWRPGARFSRPRGSLWKIARHHYFDVVASPSIQRAEWGRGWFPPERTGSEVWRWMGESAETRLPAMTGKTRLAIEFAVPAELTSGVALDVVLDGRHLDRIMKARGRVSRTYDLIASGRPAALSLRSSATLKEASGRTVSVRLRALSWGPPPSTHE